MSDYEKLTVVKLREELVNRGLPKTGLKAALIQRLVEADAQLGGPDAAPGEPAAEKTPADVQADKPATKDAAVPALTLDGVLEEESASKKDDAPGPEEPKVEVVQDNGAIHMDQTTSEVGIGAQVISATNVEPESAASLEQALDKIPCLTAEPTTEELAIQQISPDDVLPGNLTRSAGSKEPESGLQLPTPDQAQSESTQVQESLVTTSTQASVTGEEMLEDSRKRKRRSQSPPPSSLDTQQRLKVKRARPHVELPEDSAMSDAAPAAKSDHSPLPNFVPTLSTQAQINGHAQSAEEIRLDEGIDPPSTDRATVEDNTLSQNGAAEIEEVLAPEETMATSKVFKSTESPIKPSPSDTRFRNLFTAPSKTDSSAQKSPYTDAKDRIIGPALHPATSALYIRELMRPLKPENVKDHFAALATPSDTPIDASIITEFFLDSIRTHCLVGFASISAASRVRSGLHDRIWPNERDRRPLFVDFIPEEKLKQWIDVEQNTPSGRGQPSKRWEVVYEDEEGKIKAYLQEVGMGSGGIRAAKPAKADAGLGVQGAPSGPRIKDPDLHLVQPRADNGKGFQALDDLFRSTTAKPKLYFQPVPKARVNQRLDKLAAGRGGGRSDEMRRFSFQDEIIVDKGPEFGNRGRGGFGGRGGGVSGSYRARGGGYRGDSHRGGDSWRDRR
ncbi:hypothetical protein N7G274_003468 [Stereocaulon virgatum]|uniref:SAP domain-containing protein n=1 Tax=Stereocaulon virgatum TaxID=373712 RepID=A0ABR4ADT9_9LECA